MTRERAILHIDGDAFFAVCEVARNPNLRGKPVVTGRERGIVCAATYEAKRLGIHRAMPIKQVMEQFPEVIVLPGDYDLYGMYAKRLYAIARRYAARVEEYGVDECFAELTGQDKRLGESYEALARRIERDLEVELRLSFSLGLGPTKALAKLGSKHRKPRGFSVVTAANREDILAATAVKDIWGIGRALSVQFEAHNIFTALDFVRRDPAWIKAKFAAPVAELQRELSGEAVWTLHDGVPDAPHSIQRTRTFSPPARDRELVWSHFVRNVEEACGAARREGLIPARASFFIKSQDFRYRGGEARLAHPSDMPSDTLAALRAAFMREFAPGTRYRATGVTLYAFRGEDDLQLDLWDERTASRERSAVFLALDRLEEKYGEPLVTLASSLPARRSARAARRAHEDSYRERFRIPGTGRKHLPLPVLGDAR
jgi:DNA polymerase-4/DNA polymerase V